VQELRDVYAQRAISQIPRLLSLQDRSEFSPTYGCFNREFWLCRTLDFPSAIAQFGVHSLALVYANEMPGNIYCRQPKILEWILAGINYWIKIQKSDGSFDEFYPNERGWAGPTGFLLYAMLDSYRMLKEEFPPGLKERFLVAVDKSVRFLVKYDESGFLANHHAMALLPIYEAYLVLEDDVILKGFHQRLNHFYQFCYDEGWCLEYDGADPGYLSATVSFLGKLYKVFPEDRIYQIIERAIRFSSYFVYPNGFYGGSMGSRQTLHFYPHGYEIFAPKIPLAAAMADRMLIGLKGGSLVPPEIQGDRYFLYRIPEFLQSYLEYKPRPSNLPPLPYQREPFEKYFPRARIFIKKDENVYITVNLAKGGVIKVFDLSSQKLVFNDGGIIGTLDNGQHISTQWVGPEYEATVEKDCLMIKGQFHYVVSKYFTPLKMIIFRLGMILLGWHTDLAYKIKGLIRNLLMTESKTAPVGFTRKIQLEDRRILITDQVNLTGKRRFIQAKVGDEFAVRYVPQSRYFQSQELDVEGMYLNRNDLDRLYTGKRLEIKRVLDLETGELIRLT